MGKIKAKFPCGYEVEITTNIIQDLYNNELNLKECPIHGKDCKNGKDNRD